MDALLET
jgi:hypothetical protein